MANYTMTLYDLLDDPYYELFDFDYPFYTDDDTRKKEFEQKFIMNYMRYEVGFETAYSFKQELKAKLTIAMPYYKQLYESELKAKGILEQTKLKAVINKYTRLKGIKLPEENTGEKLHDTEFRQDFLTLTPKVKETEQK